MVELFKKEMEVLPLLCGKANVSRIIVGAIVGFLFLPQAVFAQEGKDVPQQVSNTSKG